VVLVGDRRSEEGHDPVPGELVHRALEKVHPVGEDREEAVHDPLPLLRVDALGQLHRAHHVAEEDRHLLAFPLQALATGADLFGQMIRRG
jgi:hypothetical protein